MFDPIALQFNSVGACIVGTKHLLIVAGLSGALRFNQNNPEGRVVLAANAL